MDKFFISIIISFISGLAGQDIVLPADNMNTWTFSTGASKDISIKLPDSYSIKSTQVLHELNTKSLSGSCQTKDIIFFTTWTMSTVSSAVPDGYVSVHCDSIRCISINPEDTTFFITQKYDQLNSMVSACAVRPESLPLFMKIFDHISIQPSTHDFGPIGVISDKTNMQIPIPYKSDYKVIEN